MPRRSIFFAICLYLFLGLPSVNEAKALKTLAFAGWSEVEITPALGIALGGRGGNYTLARQVIDPLYAHVLYLKDSNSTGFVLVSLDLVGLSHSLSDRIRQSLVYELGVEWSLVVLNTSHTHSGPNMLRELLAGVGPAPEIEVTYFNTLHDKIVDAARKAVKSQHPVDRIEVFQGESHVAINRRGRNKQGDVGILPDPKGPIDEKLWVMRIVPSGNAPHALVFSYAAHPVIVYGYAFAAVSADFPGVTRRVLRESVREVEHVQFVQGFAGNVRPRAVADLETMTFRGGSPEKLQKAGADLAQDVLATLRGKGERIDLDLAGASDRPFLPRGKPPLREVYENMTRNQGAALNSNSKAVGEYWLKRYDSGEGFAKGEPWPTGLIRLSKQQYIFHMAGEPVVEWRKLISEWMPGKKVVTFGYSQEALTYLPTESLLPEGGYEVWEANRARMSSPAAFAPGIEAAMKKSVLQQLAFINAGTTSKERKQKQ